MAWNLDTARAVANIAAGDATHDVALQRVMDTVLAEVELKLERGLFYKREKARFLHYDGRRLYLWRYPIGQVISPVNGIAVHHRNGWIEGLTETGPHGEVIVEWEGGFNQLPSDLEAAMWGAFRMVWDGSDAATGLPSAGGGVGTGSDIKRITVFDAYSVEYASNAVSGSGNAGAAYHESQMYWGALAPWASILMRYRRNVGGA